MDGVFLQITQVKFAGSMCRSRMFRQGVGASRSTDWKHKYKKGPQKKHHLGTVSKKKLLEVLNMFNGTNLILSSDVGQGAYGK